MEDIFTEGDLVQLKSGGLVMTFRRYQPDGQAYVQYATKDTGMQHAILPSGMLKHARSDALIPPSVH